MAKRFQRRRCLNIVNGRQRQQRRRTPEHGYTISSPFEPDGSGELKTTSFHCLMFQRRSLSSVFGVLYIYGHVFCKDAMGLFSKVRVRFKVFSTKLKLNMCTNMPLDPNACKVAFYHRLQGLYGYNNIISTRI